MVSRNREVRDAQWWKEQVRKAGGREEGVFVELLSFALFLRFEAGRPPESYRRRFRFNWTSGGGVCRGEVLEAWA